VSPRILVVQHEVECPPALVGEWLVEAGCVLDVRHPYAGDELPMLEEYDALLVLGGAMGAHDDAHLSWIGPTKELLRTAADSGLPTLGICLGHQLVAAALGGRSEPNPLGQQVGVLPVSWAEAATQDELFAPLATPRRGVQWNTDIVTALPPGAVVLAETDRGEVQVARFGPSIWGVQLHPEVDAAIVASWVSDTERESLAGRGLDADVLLREIEAARAELDEAWRPLAHGFADVVGARRDLRAAGTA
jgi:GMP synthase (glutamine-hydrolysing)